MPEQSPRNGLIRLRIISPIEEIASLEVERVLLPALAGDILILPNRAPCFITLKTGKVMATLPKKGGQEQIRTFFISQGICEVRRNLCPVLAWGIAEEAVNLEEIEKQLKAEEKKLSSLKERTLPETTVRMEFFKNILTYFDKPA